MNDIIFCTEDGFAVETLYLKSLPKDIRGDHLYEYFSTFGNVQSVRVHIRATDSFGFVKFQKAEAAATALKMKGHMIDGRKIRVDIARKSHQDESTANEDTPIELTNVTGTELMNLNDDCLRELWTRMTRSDLNSLLELSISTNNIRLEWITNEIFQRKRAVYHPSETGDTLDEVRRTMTNFGPLISEFSTDGDFSASGDDDSHAMKSLVRHCSGTLQSLTLLYYHFNDINVQTMKGLFSNLKKLALHFCDMKGDASDLFAHCESLVELTVTHIHRSSENDISHIIECKCRPVLRHTFPKLEFFGGEPRNDEFEDFTLRHRKLKMIKFSRSVVEQSALIPVIAKNCIELKNLQINTDGHRITGNYEKAVEAITALTRLEGLCILNDQDPFIFIQQLVHLKSLKELTLERVNGSPAILWAITQLKMLEKLHIHNCMGFADLTKIGDLVRLKDLSLSTHGNVHFDLVYVVRRLTRLETLHLDFNVPNFTIDEEVDLGIINHQSKLEIRRPVLKITYLGKTKKYFDY